MRDVLQSPPSATRLTALCAVSAALLLLQIALTKIFSIVLWYHFGFLVISIALLGFAMSGVWLARKPEVLAGGGALLARLAGWAAASTAAALWLVVHTRVDAFHVIANRNEGGLLFQVVVLLVPFFFLGATVSATLTLHRARAGKVYSANLIGSGLGCAAALALFDGLHWSAPQVALFCAALMAAAGVLYGGLRLATLWPLAVGAVCALAFFAPGRDAALHLQAPESKPLFHVEEWERTHQALEAQFKDGRRLVIDGRLEQDGEAFIVHDLHGGRHRVTLDELEPWQADEYLRPFDVVEFTEWTSLSRVDAFTWIGGESWGLWGLSSNYTGPQPRQKGITIDSWAMTNIMEWGGGEPGEEGEPPEVLEYLPASLVHRVKPEAEILCIGAGGGMDLLTAKRFGAKRIVGVEINPGVVRAARNTYLDFQGRLYDPEVHPEVELHVAEGRHFLELDEDVYDVVQLSGVDTASTTQAGAFSLSENFLYTAEAFDTYLEHTREDGFVTLTRWFLPDREGLPRNTLRLFVLAWEALERAGIEDPGAHIYLVESNAFSVILFGKTAFTDQQMDALDETADEKAFRPFFHPHFPAVKSAYENPFTDALQDNQFELYALAADKDAFLANYKYDVSSPRDDRPFFFETSRFRHMTEREAFFNSLGGITAHGILVVLLLLVGGVAWLFVVRPLREIRVVGERRGAKWAALFYFGALGLGFILVEVVLSQKFNLYLGNPVYALAVVLFSLLIFSGVGAAFSDRVRRPRLAIAAVIAMGAGYPFLCDFVFELTLAAPTWARISIAVALLAPLAFAMGMPFPLGLRRIAGDSLSAWAWGINGYASVLGSVLTVILSIAIGFNAVVWCGAAVYVVAWIASPFLGKDRDFTGAPGEDADEAEQIDFEPEPAV